MAQKVTLDFIYHHKNTKTAKVNKKKITEEANGG
jgi:hypothetical protein